MTALCTCVFPVADLAAATRWYADYFGVEPYFEQPFYVGFDVCGYELGFVPADEKLQPSIHGSEVLWGCADIEAAHARAVERGAVTLVAPFDTGEGIRVSSLADPFGNRLSLIRNPHFVVPPKGAVVIGSNRDQFAAGDVRSFTAKVEIAAEPAAVFRAWTTESELGTWFGDEARMELRVGGPFEILFFAADRPERGSEGCRVLAWIPDRMLCFSWNAPPHLPWTRARFTWVVVEIAPTDVGSEVAVTHTGWPESGFEGAEAHPEWPATWAYFQAAWPRVLDSLRQHLEGADA